MDIPSRISNLNWMKLKEEINDKGFVITAPLLNKIECNQLIHLYQKDELYRNQINMSHYRFGDGEYKYYGDPLPPIIEELRKGMYPNLAEVANSWSESLKTGVRYPLNLEDFLLECAGSNQTKPTPLILRYEEGGYNCLHQDLYGDKYFPFQVVFLLSNENDFTGGEFLLVEQRPRAQSRGFVITLKQGEGLVFPTNFKPSHGKRGYYRVKMRHGVSTIHSGTRYTLGVIFHNAE
ncbi:2OG-Fe(II) oxygenase [Aneurinibacillus tyrosinisolvens]|uniref:2OG-Fe(II) oxygenase n=1 Tax=Aneurinibacillus tyrosinisolvens TaxID=1443435 RepID=UPI00063F23F1|nr:2OG-Fe(II) oxygenase [Aneurinibacillus tyrosinisolvens]